MFTNEQLMAIGDMIANANENQRERLAYAVTHAYGDAIGGHLAFIQSSQNKPETVGGEPR